MENNKKLNRQELIELVKNIESNDFTEEEEDLMIDILEANVPHPAAGDLIFHHEPELTPEEIVDKALSYQPIVMPPPGRD